MLSNITDDLVSDPERLTFDPPVTHVYNPLANARAAWNRYCDEYGGGPKEIVLIGMNPGPPGLSIPDGGVAPDARYR